MHEIRSTSTDVTSCLSTPAGKVMLKLEAALWLLTSFVALLIVLYIGYWVVLPRAESKADSLLDSYTNESYLPWD
ncbi:hypothetical protein QR680_015714 [Steinernema hermaphroditum]|uniref:Uncharacterized protein n=1 Tax=Steinernema hermaphroditum TaxID=289476 RepID=A0AA39H9S9_9BILA|nr:hypothetical protein QR680_015714 [Steinernema hermaphroditum]